MSMATHSCWQRGPEGGGLIQVGGSWQNSDPSVRQAVKQRCNPVLFSMPQRQRMVMEVKLWFGVISPIQIR